MKKQNLKSLQLNKSLVSNLVAQTAKGGLRWTHQSESCFTDCAPPTQTGSMCLTGYQTNCQ